MPGIVCAVRGGPASLVTIKKAVEFANEQSLPLIFVYVVNIEFLSYTASSRVRTITHEMRQMGDFILLIAEEKALDMGITAKGVVRQGKVGEEIIAVCREFGADYAIMGKPKGREERDIFTHERMYRLSQRIEAESGAKVILVQDEEDE